VCFLFSETNDNSITKKENKKTKKKVTEIDVWARVLLLLLFSFVGVAVSESKTSAETCTSDPSKSAVKRAKRCGRAGGTLLVSVRLRRFDDDDDGLGWFRRLLFSFSFGGVAWSLVGARTNG
jgi:hypothetical protein